MAIVGKFDQPAKITSRRNYISDSMNLNGKNITFSEIIPLTFQLFRELLSGVLFKYFLAVCIFFCAQFIDRVSCTTVWLHEICVYDENLVNEDVTDADWTVSKSRSQFAPGNEFISTNKASDKKAISGCSIISTANIKWNILQWKI